MYHALGDALVVEVHHLLTEGEVLHERRAAFAGGERILIVADGHALVGRQLLATVATVGPQLLLLVQRPAIGGRGGLSAGHLRPRVGLAVLLLWMVPVLRVLARGVGHVLLPVI